MRIAQPLLSDAVDRIVAKAVGAVGPAIDRDLAESLRPDDTDGNDRVRGAAADGFKDQSTRGAPEIAAEEAVLMVVPLT